MGCRTCLEKMLNMEFSHAGFQTGIPPVLFPSFVLFGLCIVFLILSIVTFVLHRMWVISKQDLTYNDYFLIIGIIAICLAVVLGIIGAIWCLYATKNMKQAVDKYQAHKLSKSFDSLNRSQYSKANSTNPKVPRMDPGQSRHLEGSMSETSFNNYGNPQDFNNYGPPQDLSFGPNPVYLNRQQYPGMMGYGPGGYNPPPMGYGRGYGPPPPNMSFGPAVPNGMDYGRGGPNGMGYGPGGPYGQDPNYPPGNAYNESLLPQPMYQPPPEAAGSKLNKKIIEGVNNIKAISKRNGSAHNSHDEEDKDAFVVGKPEPFDYSQEPPLVKSKNTLANRPLPDRPDGSKGNSNDSMESAATDDSDVELVFKDGKWYKYKNGRPVGVHVENLPPGAGPSYKYVHGRPVKVENTGEVSVAGRPVIR